MPLSRPKDVLSSLALFAIVPITMSVVRPLFSNTDSYLYMNWNLLLAILPLIFAYLFVFSVGGKKVSWSWFFAWLFFLPNAPYLVTDLIHLADIGPRSLLWYDALMIFSFAWIGVVSWAISLQEVSKRITSVCLVPIVSLLSAFGMYLGRYVRHNTWDLLVRPKSLFVTIWDTLRFPLDHEPFLGFTFVFWVTLMFLYLSYRTLHQD